MVHYSSFVAPYYMKWLRNIRIIRIIFRYSNIRIMIFKLWILFVIRFSHFLPTNIIRLFDSLQNDYSWQHCSGRKYIRYYRYLTTLCAVATNYKHRSTQVLTWQLHSTLSRSSFCIGRQTITFLLKLYSLEIRTWL